MGFYNYNAPQADTRYTSQIKSQKQYEALQQQFHEWKVKKMQDSVSNLYDISGFRNMANDIQDPTETRILTETTADLKHLITGEMNVKAFRNTFLGKVYNFQYFINGGKRAMLYWSTHGLCYFVDERGNFLEMARQQYRHVFTNTLLDGCVVFHNNKYIFVINDIVQKDGVMYNSKPTTTRMKVIHEQIMPVIGVQECAFTIVFNEPLAPTLRLLKDMHGWNDNEQYKPIRLDGIEVPAGGFIFIPMNVRFQFTKKYSALTWIRQSGKSNKQMKDIVKNF